MLEREKELRAQKIQRELQDLDRQQKNLLQELYSLIGITPKTASRKTSRNRLTPEQAMRLC